MPLDPAMCLLCSTSALRNTRFRNATVHLSPKWADFGKVGGNGEKCGKFWMLGSKMGNFGLKKVKKHGFDWQQGYGGGGAMVKAPEEKWGEMGENGGTKPVHLSPTIFVICPHLQP